MLKAYLLGMQGLAWEGAERLFQGGVAWQPQRSGTVQGIAYNGVPEVRQVHADLMGAAGFEGETQEAQGPPGFQHLVVGTGGAAVPRDYGHLLPMLGMAPNRRINGALQRRESSTHQRHITPLQLACLQLC